jgi:pantoate--beta-alanine ligase
MTAMLERGAGRVVRTIAELRDLADATRAAGGTVGFMGTSGNLHVGHLTIMRRMASECDLAVIPLHETEVKPVPGLLDFSLAGGYQRDGQRDRTLAMEAGIDVVFMADRSETYRTLPVRIHVTPVPELASPWENAEDPAFMRMTATAVTKYWNIVGPCRYYLGEKDWVPLTVLRKVVDDLSVRVDLIACPIVRLPDGLCASSRNAKLSPQDRAAAPALYAALREAADLVDRGERRAAAVRDLLRRRVEAVAKLDYAEVVDARTLERADPLRGELRLVVGADFSGVHLFDNAGVTIPESEGGSGAR